MIKSYTHKKIKQALYHGFLLQKVSWLVKTMHRYQHRTKKKKQKRKKKGFEKEDLLNLMHNPVFGKIMVHMRKHRDIKLTIAEARRHYLESEPNYQTKTFFSDNILATDMNKKQRLRNKPVYLGPSALEISKYLCINFGMITCKKNRRKAESFDMDTDSFIVYMKTNDIIYVDIAKDVNARPDTSNYELE